MPVNEITDDAIDRNASLSSMPIADLFDVLDLRSEALAPVREAVSADGEPLRALLEHFRRRFPSERGPETDAPDPAATETADKLTRHIFQWGPYEKADYGPDVDWAWDPCGDIEWVAAMYRFYWARTLASAYAGTGDERYARAFTELTADWIAKHPLQEHQRTHSTYTRWHGFAWLDLQTGIRATSLCAAFRAFLHSEAMTPAFLGTFLASLYDHQVKTELIPMGVVHNKAVFEQRGFITVASQFPEFADTRRWLELAHRRTRENLLAQTTADGVQREWSFGYHMGVLRDAVEIQRLLAEAGVAVADDYAERVRLMHEYVFDVATPDLATPMFGDASRPRAAEGERTTWPLYGFLKGASELLGDPKYAALADLDTGHLPQLGSCAFPEAGIYVMRSGWDADAICATFHCAPPAISSHDHLDNGTFELCAFGRWLMPDSGFYTYGHDPEGRAWHRRTASHQTLTLNGADSADAGRHVFWASSADGDVLIVENEAYDGLLHRRTVWFVGRQFLVILDEAVGDAAGDLDLHFQFGPGPHRLEPFQRRAWTCFGDDGNVLVASIGKPELVLSEEEGWWGWGYGKREPRPAIRFRHPRQAPAAFTTLVVPYRGARPPEIQLEQDGDWETAIAASAATARLAGDEWDLGRDLSGPSAWCRRTATA